MTTILVAFFLAFVSASVLCLVLIPMAYRFGIVDRPDGYRKSQKRAVPRLGGVAVFVGFTLPLLAVLWFPELTLMARTVSDIANKCSGLIVCGGLALLLGLFDDSLDMRSGWKFAGQLLVAFIAYKMGFVIDGVSTPFGNRLVLGYWSFPVTIFWFVACMNAVNLLDGMDGLAAGVCLFVGVTLFSVSLLSQNYLGMLLMVVMAGSVSGFLMFNFPPARMYLGDSGSIFLGFLIAALSLVGAHHKAETAVALFVPIVALGLPIVDTSLAILRRWYHKLPISTPDRGHIHHVLRSMGYSPRRAVLLLYGICVAFGIGSLLIMIARNEVVLLVMLLIGVLVYVSVRLFSGMKFGDLVLRVSRDIAYREKSKAVRVAVERVVNELEGVKEVSEFRELCGEAFGVLGLARVKMRLDKDSAQWAGDSWQWERRESADTPSGADDWTIRMALTSEGRRMGSMVVSGVEGDLTETMLQEAPELIDRIRNAIADRIGRGLGQAVLSEGGDSC